VVADGEGVGQCVIEGEILSGEVAHGHRSVGVAVAGQMGHHELVHGAAVPALMLGTPVMGEVVRRLAVVGGWVVQEMEGLEVAGRINSGSRLVSELVEHRVRLARHLLVPDVAVGESAHVRQGPEVVVERPILLHEKDDMLDVLQAGPFGDIDRQRGVEN
jgi:hypothetical protein